MPVFREPRWGQTVVLAGSDTGGIKTLQRLGWQDVTPQDERTGGDMPVLQNPKTGELAEVGIHERERLADLTRDGWVDVSGQPVTVGIEVTEEVKEPHRVGDPVLVVTETPIEPDETPAPTKRDIAQELRDDLTTLKASKRKRATR